MARTGVKIKADLPPMVSLQVGEIVEVDDQGQAFVTSPGSNKPVPARSTLAASVRVGESPQALVGAPVLLAYENGDPSLPIIVGLVRDVVRPAPEFPALELELGKNRDVLVDGRRLVFEAQNEIELRCGKSTILLQSDGKVLIRGAHLVSRSSGPNKIKGGSISLN